MKSVTNRFLSSCEYIIKNGLAKSFKDIAEKAGLSVSIITEIKKGRTSPGSNTIKKFVSEFKVINRDWLLSGNGEMLDLENTNSQGETVELRLLEVMKIIGVGKIQIMEDLNLSEEEVKPLFEKKINRRNQKLVDAFCSFYGIREPWIWGSGDYPFEFNHNGFKYGRNYIPKYLKELNNNLLEIEQLEQKLSEYDGSNEKLNRTLGLINEIKNTVNRKIKIMGGAESKLQTTQGKLQELGIDFLKTEELGTETYIVELGNMQKAIMIPMIDIYNLNKYPQKYNDRDFIKQLPKIIFRLYDKPRFILDYEERNIMALYIKDDSMDDCTKDSICKDDVVVGQSWSKESIILNTYQRSGPREMIIVTKDQVICRDVRKVNRQDNFLLCRALNPDKKTYPDLKIPLDNVLELYKVIRIERNH